MRGCKSCFYPVWNLLVITLCTYRGSIIFSIYLVWQTLIFVIVEPTNSQAHFSGLSENPSPSKDSTKADSHSSSRSNTGLKVLLICLGAIALVLLSYFLFKKWQKKKREEQHARLLKLFEEDDDLEVELGLRDWEIFAMDWISVRGKDKVGGLSWVRSDVPRLKTVVSVFYQKRL